MLEARNIVAQALGLDVTLVTSEASMDSLDKWDSMGHLRLVMAIEERVQTELDPAEVVQIMTVQDVGDILTRHANKE